MTQSPAQTPDWAAAYRHFDDDALAALASAGLLRRAAKDVEAGKVGWHPDGGPAAGLVAADGQRVRLAAQGPAATRCDCPAPGVCKHVLAAALWLRTASADAADASPDAQPDATPAAAPAPAADALAEVLALDQAPLFKAAGIAAVRKAAALLPTLEQVDISPQGALLLVALPELDLVCRYVAGTGVEGMVSEAEPRARKALHLLALAAVWRAHGRAVAWPAQAGVPEPGAPALGEDERRFLAQARALVHEVCAAGWSHVSDIAAPQLRALATSARVESFPRLAGLLRALAGTAELLARRDFAADERDALAMAAEAHALVHALAAAGHAGDAALLARLRGAAQRSFAQGHALELLPLGAAWWETRGGARGLTAAFWDPLAATIRQAVLARRDAGDRQFNRDSAWRTNTLWLGAGPPATLAGHALTLEQPRLADDGRLGVGGVTRAQTAPGWRLDDDRWRQAGIDDWAALRTAVAAQAGLLGERNDLVLLRPAACLPPRLDEVRQQLTWRLIDRHGAALLLRLPYEPWKARRLENLEAWTGSGAAIAGVVARLERDGGGAMLEPVSLLVERDGRPHAVSLDFERGPAHPTLAARIGRMLQRRPAPGAARAPRAHQRVLDAVLAQLERRAMSGHLHLAGDAGELRALHPTLLALGLDIPARLLDRYLAAPDTGRALDLVQAVRTCLALDTSFVQS